jgi:3-hydroxy-3-methylglutaryl CoA synthase
MVGIISYGAYIPFLRLKRSAISKDSKGEKALANFDEDSITMAVAAVLDCLRGLEREFVDGLFFASTTSPYKEKQAATIVAVAADLRRDILTADYANTLKSGTNAFRSACDAVAAGTAKKIMVVAGDTRLGAPGSVFEQHFGDGAAAFLIGSENVVVSLEASYSMYHEIMDVWRPESSLFVRSWEPRFTETEGYQRSMEETISGLLKKTNLEPRDFAKVVLYTSDPRSSALLAEKLGFDAKSQLQDPLFDLIGNTGSAYALMLLVAALEESKPGDYILLANYGNGADSFVFKVTENIKNLGSKRGIKQHLVSKLVIDDYRTYLYNRDILPETNPVYPVPFGNLSAPALYREVEKNLRLHATKCDYCGTVQYPPQRVCFKCHKKDQFQSVRLSDKTGTLFTFSMDYVSSMVDSPAVIVIVDFEGGGRMECFMTDRVVKDIHIDMDIEMTFRKLFEREEMINYFWKAMPVRC